MEWAVAQNILKGVMVSIVEDQLNENCTTYNTTSFETSGYVQAAIGDVSYDCSNDIFTHSQDPKIFFFTFQISMLHCIQQ